MAPLVRGRLATQLEAVLSECRSDIERIELLCEMAIQQSLLGRDVECHESLHNATEIAQRIRREWYPALIRAEAATGGADAAIARVIGDLSKGRGVTETLSLVAVTQAEFGDFAGAWRACQLIDRRTPGDAAVKVTASVATINAGRHKESATELLVLAEKQLRSIQNSDLYFTANAEVALALAANKNKSAAMDRIREGRTLRSGGDGFWVDVCHLESAAVFVGEGASARTALDEADPGLIRFPHWPVVMARHCIQAKAYGEAQELANVLRKRNVRHESARLLNELIVALIADGRDAEAEKVFQDLDWTELGLSVEFDSLGSDTVFAMCRSLMKRGNSARAEAIVGRDNDSDVDVGQVAGLIGCLDGVVLLQSSRQK